MIVYIYVYVCMHFLSLSSVADKVLMEAFFKMCLATELAAPRSVAGGVQSYGPRPEAPLDSGFKGFRNIIL